jgi:hypothetical protein
MYLLLVLLLLLLLLFLLLYSTMLCDTLRAQVNSVKGAKRLEKSVRFPKPRRGIMKNLSAFAFSRSFSWQELHPVVTSNVHHKDSAWRHFTSGSSHEALWPAVPSPALFPSPFPTTFSRDHFSIYVRSLDLMSILNCILALENLQHKSRQWRGKKHHGCSPWHAPSLDRDRDP